MREVKVAPTLVNEWIERTGLPWSRAVVAVGLVLFPLWAGTAYMDGALTHSLDSDTLRLTLFSPVSILYILSAYHLLISPLNKAINAFTRLITVEQDAFERLIAEASALNRRREWLFFGVGAGGGLLLALRIWNGPEQAAWLRGYWLLFEAVACGLVGWAIYASLVYAGLITKLHQQPLKLDIFNPIPLEPVARYGLGLSLAFVGGITLSMLFAPSRKFLLSIEFISVYVVLILVSVLVFFLTLINTHNVMAEAKRRELTLVRERISRAYQKLRQQTDEDQLQNMEALSDSITAWLAYEKRIVQAPEWPYTTDILRNLVMSILLPVAAWVTQIVVEVIR